MDRISGLLCIASKPRGGSHHMNLIHPSQPSHRNFFVKNSPTVKRLIKT